MRMSTKGRFAVDALIDLALRERNGPVALAAIANRQRVSLSYLEQLFSRLRTRGLVASTRGPGGGYTLGRAAAEISVADIVTAVDEGADSPVPGERAHPLSDALWRRLATAMLQQMAAVSLQSLVDEQLAQGVAIETPSPRRSLPRNPVLAPLTVSAPNSVFALGRSFAG